MRSLERQTEIRPLSVTGGHLDKAEVGRWKPGEPISPLARQDYKKIICTEGKHKGESRI